jgi:serine/threonine protein kinase
MTVSRPKKKLFHGRFEIQTIIGRGSKSVVYRARVSETTEEFLTRATNLEYTPNSKQLINKSLLTGGLTVALKVSLPSLTEESRNKDRLKAEALALLSCQHRLIIRLYDVQVHDVVCYLALQYAPFGDLRKYAIQKKGGIISPLEGQTLFKQALEALTLIHSVGIIHRDIKPDNLLIVAPDNLCLGDFGVASFSGDNSNPTELAKAVGTLDYLAPEVLSGIRCDEKSDLYSLALSFYEMLSGKHPFSNQSLISQVEARNKLPPSIEKFLSTSKVSPISPELAQVIMNCLHPDVSRRPSSAKDALQQLNKVPLKTIVKRILPKFVTSKPLIDKATIQQIHQQTDIKYEKEHSLLNDSSVRAVVSESLKNESMSDDPDNKDNYDQSDRNIRADKLDSIPKSGASNSNKDRLKASRARTETELLTPEQLQEVRKKFGAKVENGYAEKPHKKTAKKDAKSTGLHSKKTRSLIFLKISKLLILCISCLALGLVILYRWTIKSRPQSSSVKSTDPSATETAKQSQAKFTLPQYTGAPLTFPALPEGIFHGLIEGLIPTRSIPLAFLSFGSSAPLTVLIGLEGFQIASVNINPNENSLKIPANGYILEFTSTKISEQSAISGNVANLTTGEIGTWKVIPQRSQ